MPWRILFPRGEIGDTLLSINGSTHFKDTDVIDRHLSYDSADVILENGALTQEVSPKKSHHVPFPNTVITYGIIPPYRMYASIEKRTGKQGHYDGSRIIFSNKRSR